MIHPFEEYDVLLVSCFSGPVSDVSAHLTTSMAKASGRSYLPQKALCENRYHLVSVPLDFRYAYVGQFAAHLKWDPRQIIFWEPVNAPGTTAMMSNSSGGNMHQVGAFSRNVPWASLFVQICSESEEHIVNFFNYYNTAVAGRNGRTLSVGQEENGRWGFWHGGPVQPFENPEYYKRRRIRDRLNRDVIAEYLNKLGWDIRDQAFWTSKKPAVLMWDDWLGRRSAPGRDGVDPDGTRTGWTPEPENPASDT